MQSEGNPSKVQPEARLFQPLKLKDRVTVAFPAHDYPAFQAKWEDIRPPADWLGAAKESKDIVIVGAGMAGITAAQHLRRARVKSVVFESRSRVGGRMCSFKPSEAVDAVNIGANYLHGCDLEGGNPIFNVSKTTSLRFIDNVVDNHRYLKQPSAQEREGYGISAELNAPPPDLGSKSAMNTPDEADVICQKADFDEDTIAAMYELYGKLDAAVSRKGLQLFRSSDGSDASVYELIQEVLQEGTFTALLAQLDEKHRTSEFMDLLHARLTSQLAYVCPIDQLSARDMGVTYEAGTLDGDHVVVANGFDTIVKEWSKDIDVQLGTKVLGILHDPNDVGCLVVTERLSQEGESLVDYHPCHSVIITASVGVLKSKLIKFDPPLPSSWSEALQHSAMGTENRVVLHFDRWWWQSGAHVLRIAQRPWLRIMIPDLNQERDSGHAYTAVLFFAPPMSYRLSQMDTTAIVSFALELMVEACKQPLALLEASLQSVAIALWDQDLFAQGSYSCIVKGQSLARVLTIAEATNRIHFAGEALSANDTQQVHGAYSTGLRSAETILQRLGTNCISEETVEYMASVAESAPKASSNNGRRLFSSPKTALPTAIECQRCQDAGFDVWKQQLWGRVHAKYEGTVPASIQHGFAAVVGLDFGLFSKWIKLNGPGEHHHFSPPSDFSNPIEQDQNAIEAIPEAQQEQLEPLVAYFARILAESADAVPPAGPAPSHVVGEAPIAQDPPPRQKKNRRRRIEVHGSTPSRYSSRLRGKRSSQDAHACNDNVSARPVRAGKHSKPRARSSAASMLSMPQAEKRSINADAGLADSLRALLNELRARQEEAQQLLDTLDTEPSPAVRADIKRLLDG